MTQLTSEIVEQARQHAASFDAVGGTGAYPFSVQLARYVILQHEELSRLRRPTPGPDIVEEVAFALCPHLVEARIASRAKCRRCPRTVETDYGTGTNLCRLQATDAARAAIAAYDRLRVMVNVDRLVFDVLTDVGELPDRTSPDDWPEAMLVTDSELSSIIRARIAEQAAAVAGEEG